MRALAAIAPSEGLFEPRASHPRLRDQNYLVMGGSLDGDNGTSFMGEAQYSHVHLSGRVDALKASVYIKDANHGQFNTAWGRNDAGTAYRFLTDERSVMSGSDQRRIAATYLAAFLAVTLQGKSAYRGLLQDPRSGAAWLPDVFIVANYADSGTRWLANFERDGDPTTGTDPDVRLAGENLSIWRETDPQLKLSRLGSHVAILGWDDRVHPAGSASYGIVFREPMAVSPDTDLVFSAAQLPIDTLPLGFHTTGPRREPRMTALDWTIVVRDVSGQTARLALAHDQVLYPQIRGEPYRGGIFRGHDSELVMRRYRFALRDFLVVNPQLDPGRLEEIRFVFDRSRAGAISLDDVGLAPSFRQSFQ